MHYLGFKIKIPDVDKAVFTVPYGDLLAGHRASLHAHGLQDYRLFLDEETNTLFCIMRVNKRVSFNEQLKSQLIQQWYKSILPTDKSKEMEDVQWSPLKDVFHLNDNISKVF
ncbi:L-rhamnose mutarotase [Ilyomonas limi]|uniref:L-rhamnose mutarotase n=1 Tax=Ilyomonas limi TaxID=2575867 RepID=A0A4U3L970_9BACT|nr:L-rhamnose mutarotase [Ilyomonas limi]TKK71838.1 L-rhamnose mutarotase [Ilyomonas limi]